MCIDKSVLSSQILLGEVFQNPGGGTSVIKSINDSGISYIRGNSTIKLPVNILNNVCKIFSNKECSSNDLKCLEPNVFDSSKKVIVVTVHSYFW